MKACFILASVGVVGSGKFVCLIRYSSLANGLMACISLYLLMKMKVNMKDQVSS